MRRNVGRHLLMVLGAVVLMGAALPAFAQTPAPTTPATPAATATAKPSTPLCPKYAGLTAKMAGCIRDQIDNGAKTFFDQIYPYFQNAIGAAMTLAVIVYGVALAFGAVEKVGRDTYVIMMKLSVVVIMCNSSPWIVSTVTGIMDGAIEAVVSYAPAGGTADSAGTDFSNTACLQTMIRAQTAADPSLPTIGPWLGVDCLIDTVIGIHIAPDVVPTNDGEWFNKNLATDKEGMSRSLLYLFFGCMESSILGLIMAVIGFIFIFGLLMLIVRCFFVYIAGYLGVTFLAIISPLIIPMILFKETKQYFDKWVKMFISFALQPVIMLVFLIFSIATIDIAVYSGTYSVYYAIAGEASQASGFNLNKYMEDKKIVDKTSKEALLVKADSPQAVPKAGQDTAGILKDLVFAKCTPDAIKKDPSLKAQCSFEYPVSLVQTTIHWDKMEDAREPPVTKTDTPGQAESQAVLASLFFCVMVVFVLNGLLAVVPMIVGDLLGDLNQSPILGGIGTGGKRLGSGSGIGNSIARTVAAPFKKFSGMVGR